MPKAQCGDYQQLQMRPDRDATHWQINRTRFNPNFLFLKPQFVQPCHPSQPRPSPDPAPIRFNPTFYPAFFRLRFHFSIT